MNFFGVGTTEIFVILLVVLVLFGPDKLPEIAKKIGSASRELRGGLNSITEQMNSALEASMEADKALMTPPAEVAAGSPEPTLADASEPSAAAVPPTAQLAQLPAPTVTAVPPPSDAPAAPSDSHVPADSPDSSISPDPAAPPAPPSTTLDG